ELELSELTPSYLAIIKKKEELEYLRGAVKELEKNFNRLVLEANSLDMSSYLDKVININDKQILVFKEENINIEAAKDLLDRLSDHLKDSLIFLAIVCDKVVFLCKN